MTAISRELSSLQHHPFWIFSCQIYAQTEVFLLELQNRYDLNLSVLLFCFWSAANNYGALAKQDMKQILTGIHVWHKRIVLPLRQLRTSLKRVGFSACSGLLHQEILEVELLAEQIEEMLIHDAAPKKQRTRTRTTQQRAIQVCQNIMTYCQSIYVVLDEKDCERIGQILQLVLPEMTIEDHLEICRMLLLHRPHSSKKAGQPRQLQLELELPG